MARSEPDGYTLYFTTAGVAVVYPHLRSTRSYDPITDFTAVGLVAFNSTMLVVRRAGGKTARRMQAIRLRRQRACGARSPCP